MEMLIVLGLMALLLGMVAPSLYRSFEQERTRAALREVGSALRLARSLAIARQQPVRVFFSLDQGRFWLDGGLRNGRLPGGTKILQATLVWEDSSRRLGSVVFFSDGSSSGGDLYLMDARGRRYALKVDLITSRVSLGAG